MSTIPDNLKPDALRREADRREHLEAVESLVARYDGLLTFMASLLGLEHEEREAEMDVLVVPKVQTMRAVLEVEKAHEEERGWFRGLQRDRREPNPIEPLGPIPEEILRYARRENLEGWRERTR